MLHIKTKLTRKQIGDGVRIPNPRVKAALGHLTDQNRIKHVDGSGVTTTYEIIGSPLNRDLTRPYSSSLTSGLPSAIVRPRRSRRYPSIAFLTLSFSKPLRIA